MLNALPTFWELCSDSFLVRADCLQLTSCDPLISWPWQFPFSPSHRPLSEESFLRRFEMVASQNIYLIKKQFSHLDPRLLLHFVLFLQAWAAPPYLITSEFPKHQFCIHLHTQSPWETHVNFFLEICHLVSSMEAGPWVFVVSEPPSRSWKASPLSRSVPKKENFWVPSQSGSREIKCHCSQTELG